MQKDNKPLMSFDEIIASFNTPSQIKVNNLRQHNLILEKQMRLNNKAIGRLADKVNKEQDAVANMLDKKYKDWRRIIVKNNLKNL